MEDCEVFNDEVYVPEYKITSREWQCRCNGIVSEAETIFDPGGTGTPSGSINLLTGDQEERHIVKCPSGDEPYFLVGASHYDLPNGKRESKYFTIAKSDNPDYLRSLRKPSIIMRPPNKEQLAIGEAWRQWLIGFTNARRDNKEEE